MRGAARHEAHLVALADLAVDHPDLRDDADVRVVVGVEDQRAQRRRALRRRRGDFLDDRLQNLVDPDALRRGGDRVGAVDADGVLHLGRHAVDVGARQVDLVQDRHDLEVALEREVDVGDRLRLDALRRVDDEERALARRERARDLVAEVDVARRVDQVEDVLLAVLRRVAHPRAVELDRDPALALDVHRVAHLVLHLAVGERPRLLQQPVRQRRLAVVDVRDDAEVAYPLRLVVALRRRRPGRRRGGGARNSVVVARRRVVVLEHRPRASTARG